MLQKTMPSARLRSITPLLTGQPYYRIAVAGATQRLINNGIVCHNTSEPTSSDTITSYRSKLTAGIEAKLNDVSRKHQTLLETYNKKVP